MNKKIPLVTVPRISLYYRALLESRHKDYISSEEIAYLTGFNSAQVRKDLAYFGQFGTPGKGYKVESLKKALLSILGTDRIWNVALVGVGNLGSALLSYKGFEEQGFKIVAAFDKDMRKIGKVIRQVKIQDIKDLEDTIHKKNIKIVILAIPAKHVQAIVDRLIKGGIKAILNFAPIRPKIPSDIHILNIDLSIELERLAYFLNKLR
ncbi:MAG: redox-sensing transcriptional repressor Rex [Candidatus Omnitrophica bacterium]|nr:redox-sensing transcriptional repressor Rex [Candidatus Omnitrophota bacterium]MCM8799653.1 redox-sensing transcriptional repressor Rex [Candidatus Omnitrophota bacterium]